MRLADNLSEHGIEYLPLPYNAPPAYVSLFQLPSPSPYPRHSTKWPPTWTPINRGTSRRATYPGFQTKRMFVKKQKQVQCCQRQHVVVQRDDRGAPCMRTTCLDRCLVSRRPIATLPPRQSYTVPPPSLDAQFCADPVNPGRTIARGPMPKCPRKYLQLFCTTLLRPTHRFSDSGLCLSCCLVSAARRRSGWSGVGK